MLKSIYKLYSGAALRAKDWCYEKRQLQQFKENAEEILMQKLSRLMKKELQQRKQKILKMNLKM